MPSSQQFGFGWETQPTQMTYLMGVSTSTLMDLIVKEDNSMPLDYVKTKF